MYTQQLENPHNTQSAPNEFPRLARRWRPQLNHPFIYFRNARPRRNTTQVKIIVNWLLGFIHDFRDIVQDKSFNLTTGAARFKWLLNSKQTMQTRQSFRCTQCPNSLTRFHSLLQVNCMSGLMKGIVNEGIGGDFGYSLCFCFPNRYTVTDILWTFILYLIRSVLFLIWMCWITQGLLFEVLKFDRNCYLSVALRASRVFLALVVRPQLSEMDSKQG